MAMGHLGWFLRNLSEQIQMIAAFPRPSFCFDLLWSLGTFPIVCLDRKGGLSIFVR